ncbi:MAG: peptidylprolyl isomerase [Chloroflexi bacterium]|nr:peptidylprolyl isomerase [Chloroflexota bacterium]
MPKDGKRALQETRKQSVRRAREQRQERILYYVLGGIAAVVLIVIGIGYYQENIGKLNAPIAVVNGKEISARAYQQSMRLTGGSLLSQLDQINQNLAQMQTDASLAFLRDYLVQQQNQVVSQLVGLPRTQLEQIIDDELIRQAATQRGITISAEEIDEEIEQQFGYARATRTPTAGPSPTATNTATPTRTPTITPTATPSPSPTGTITPTTPTVTPTPAPTSEPGPTPTPMTLQGFQDQKKKYLDSLSKNAQVSESEFRRLIETLLLRQKLQAEISKTVPTVEEQIEARHILLKTMDEAIAVQERLKKGEDFTKLAQELSQDPGSKASGGDLGWFGRGQMVKEFEDAAFALQPNQISQPISTTFGVHILQVVTRDPNRALDPSALSAKQNVEFSNWLQKVRGEAKVERYFQQQFVPKEIANAIAQITSGQ